MYSAETPPLSGRAQAVPLVRRVYAAIFGSGSRVAQDWQSVAGMQFGDGHSPSNKRRHLAATGIGIEVLGAEFTSGSAQSRTGGNYADFGGMAPEEPTENEEVRSYLGSKRGVFYWSGKLHL